MAVVWSSSDGRGTVGRGTARHKVDRCRNCLRSCIAATASQCDGIVIHRDELFEDEVRLVRRHRRDDTCPDGVRPRPPRPSHASASIAVDALGQRDAVAVVGCHAAGGAPPRRAGPGSTARSPRPDGRRRGIAAGDPHEVVAHRRRTAAAADADRIVQRDGHSRRIDMGWEEFRVGVEYDGPQHWTDPAASHARHRQIRRTVDSVDWRIVRVSA